VVLGVVLRDVEDAAVRREFDSAADALATQLFKDLDGLRSAVQGVGRSMAAFRGNYTGDGELYSAQALQAMEEVMAEMPANIGYEWSGLTLQEKKSAGQAPLILGMAVVFVFLLLAAQYESWSLPFAVLLSVPTVILGTLTGLLLRNFELNVYAQIGLVMLIGLAAKNAILIVEFAKMKREQGMTTLEAALEGAKLRLRPILMTSFAFILGCVPLMLASGSGAASRSTMGTGVVFGMSIATLLGIFLIPVCYAFVQGFADRRAREKSSVRAESLGTGSSG
jgi:HAE1 family hydrophobic/amphiphilic exporter-1/multidrug efflux pump